MDNNKEYIITTFEFPIRDALGEVRMKSIPHSTLQNVHGLTTKDPNTFLLKLDILCHSYDYTYDVQKLKLFPTTLKDATLCWFMHLGRETITS